MRTVYVREIIRERVFVDRTIVEVCVRFFFYVDRYKL